MARTPANERMWVITAGGFLIVSLPGSSGLRHCLHGFAAFSARKNTEFMLSRPGTGADREFRKLQASLKVDLFRLTIIINS